jgi:hypothetical protein
LNFTAYLETPTSWWRYMDWSNCFDTQQKCTVCPRQITRIQRPLHNWMKLSLLKC